MPNKEWAKASGPGFASSFEIAAARLPYSRAVRKSPIRKWNITSGAITFTSVTASPMRLAIAKLPFSAVAAASPWPCKNMSDTPSVACRCISSLPPRCVVSSARIARSDQRRLSVKSDIATKTGVAAEARRMPNSSLPRSPKHHCSAARTLAMFARCKARSGPFAKLCHLPPASSSHC